MTPFAKYFVKEAPRKMGHFYHSQKALEQHLIFKASCLYPAGINKQFSFFLTGLNLYLFTTSFYFCSWCPTFCFSLTYYGAFSHSCYRRVKVNFPVRKLGQKTRRPPCLGILIKQSCSFSDRYSFWTFFHPLCPHIAFSFFLWAPSGWVLLGHSNPTEASWYHLGHDIILFPYCSLLLPTPIWVYFLSYEEDTKELSD